VSGLFARNCSAGLRDGAAATDSTYGTRATASHSLIAVMRMSLDPFRSHLSSATGDIPRPCNEASDRTAQVPGVLGNSPVSWTLLSPPEKITGNRVLRVATLPSWFREMITSLAFCGIRRRKITYRQTARRPRKSPVGGEAGTFVAAIRRRQHEVIGISPVIMVLPPILEPAAGGSLRKAGEFAVSSCLGPVTF
jgi:hypothetical protein